MALTTFDWRWEGQKPCSYVAQFSGAHGANRPPGSQVSHPSAPTDRTDAPSSEGLAIQIAKERSIFMYIFMRAKSLQSCPTLWMVACQSPLSMGFSRQGYWSVLPCPPPGDLPNPGIKSVSLKCPASAGMFFTTSTTIRKPLCSMCVCVHIVCFSQEVHTHTHTHTSYLCCQLILWHISLNHTPRSNSYILVSFSVHVLQFPSALKIHIPYP